VPTRINTGLLGLQENFTFFKKTLDFKPL